MADNLTARFSENSMHKLRGIGILCDHTAEWSQPRGLIIMSTWLIIIYYCDDDETQPNL